MKWTRIGTDMYSADGRFRISESSAGHFYGYDAKTNTPGPLFPTLDSAVRWAEGVALNPPFDGATPFHTTTAGRRESPPPGTGVSRE